MRKLLKGNLFFNLISVITELNFDINGILERSPELDFDIFNLVEELPKVELFILFCFEIFAF